MLTGGSADGSCFEPTVLTDVTPDETPAAYGLPFEEVTFATSDGVELSGWIVGEATDRVIVQSHFGVQCSRCGYTQEGKGVFKNTPWTSDIHFLEHAKYLVDAGYAVLMYDLRSHGDSGSAQDRWITWGQDERKDVVAAVDFISAHERFAEAEIGLLSICMGAASTTFAYGLEPALAANQRVKAMIAVQPLTYDYFVEAMGMPKVAIAAGNKYNSEKRGVDLTGDSFLPYAKDVTVPTLVIQNKNDPMTNKDMVDQYFTGLTVEKELLWLDLEPKRGAAYAWLGSNPEPILDWFGRYL